MQNFRIKEAVFCNTDLAYLPCHLHTPPLPGGSSDQEHPCSPQTIDKGKKAGNFWKIKKFPQAQI